MNVQDTATAPVRKMLPVHWVLLACAILAILVSFYTYLLAKRYDFLVEAACDPARQQCYTRDCSTGDCPPNNLAVYTVFKLPANRFDACTDNACSNLCPSEGVCVEIPCSSQSEVKCTGPSSPL